MEANISCYFLYENNLCKMLQPSHGGIQSYGHIKNTSQPDLQIWYFMYFKLSWYQEMIQSIWIFTELWHNLHEIQLSIFNIQTDMQL